MNEVKASLNQIGVFMQINMSVGHFWCDNKLIKVDQDESRLDMFDTNTLKTGLGALLRCSILCNKAEFKNEDINLKRPALERETTTPSHEFEPQAAILRMCEHKFSNDGKVTSYRARNPTILDIPYNSLNKYQARE